MQSKNQALKVEDIFKKENIICTLVNRERNRELLKSIPYTPFHDMAVTYRILMEKTDNGFASILITNDIMEKYQIDRATLLNTSVKNTMRLLPAKVELMTDVLSEFLQETPGILNSEEEKLFGSMEEPSSPLYIVSNTLGLQGATVVLYDNLIQRLADQLQSNLVIIPSSTHEFLVSREGTVPLSTYSQMVRDVNKTLLEKEILSDRAFIYDWKTQNYRGEGN